MVYQFSLIISALYAVARFKKAGRSLKMICLLIWLGLLTEALGLYAAKVYRNNYPVYTISVYIEFTLICLYFNYSVEALKKSNAGIYIAVIGVLLGVVNTYSLQPLTTLNSNFLFLECLVVVCLSLFAIYELLLIDRDDLVLHRTVNFWMTFLLFFYQCSSLSAWGLYDKFGNDYAQSAAGLDISLLSINIITYLSYLLIFFRHSKLKLTDVQY